MMRRDFFFRNFPMLEMEYSNLLGRFFWRCISLWNQLRKQVSFCIGVVGRKNWFFLLLRQRIFEDIVYNLFGENIVQNRARRRKRQNRHHVQALFLLACLFSLLTFGCCASMPSIEDYVRACSGKIHLRWRWVFE